jgi:hypothetical protein
MNEHLRRALDAMETGASEARQLTSQSTHAVRERVRRATQDVLGHLERDAETLEAQSDDVVSRLSKQSQDIADELRRVERLMKDRLVQK